MSQMIFPCADSYVCFAFRQGICYHLFGEMHACDLVPTVTGNFLLRRVVLERRDIENGEL